MTTAADVVTHARSFLGVRYAHQGRTVAGLDCAGLVIRVAHDLGLTAFDTTAYGRVPQGDNMRALMREHCREVFDLPAPGLIALMKFEVEPQHVAIIGDHSQGLSAIHALAANRRVTEHRLDTKWAGRIVGLFALPGVAY